jgi:hypothetical protein
VWNTQPGYVYLVQTAATPLSGWTTLGAPRFAAGLSDSLVLGAGPAPAFFRVLRVR